MNVNAHPILQMSFAAQKNTAKQNVSFVRHCPVHDISVMLPNAFTFLPSELLASPSRSDKEQQLQINHVSQVFSKSVVE